MDSMDKYDKYNEREVEQWMDTALSQYGEVEPRTGLAARVLANLQSERGRIALRRRWWWAGGTVAVAAIVVAVWLGESGIHRRPSRSVENAGFTHQENSGVPKAPIAQSIADRRPKKIRGSRPHGQPGDDSEARTPPKLEQFPAPQPLNEQEEILASYVRNYPKHAAMIAQARTEALRKDCAEKMGASTSEGDDNSEQQMH